MTDARGDDPSSPARRPGPRSPAAWAGTIIGTTFLVLWAVFAARAVDRNADPTVGPSPPDLQATYDAAASLALPPGSDSPGPVDLAEGTPGAATPVGIPASPVASPVVSPLASPAQGGEKPTV